jgi:catechol 2,3-dioxygenase-like lactoylglutathione lyase family enzyme
MTLQARHIAELGLRAKDLPYAVTFYQEVLGLELVRALPTLGEDL